MSEPRLLLVAMPDAATRRALEASFSSIGLHAQLGGDLFAPGNWHQSFSDRYNDTAENRRLLTEVGAAVSAAPFVLGFNRFQCSGGPRQFHWSLKPSKTPDGFKLLQDAVKAALAARRLDDDINHSAHVTVSYWAKFKAENRPIPPVLWKIGELMLVRGGGEPYEYLELARWPLSAAPEGQLDFFGGL